MAQQYVSNGVILTQDRERPIADAMLVDHGIVAAVGREDEVLPRVSPRAERLDLAGRAACPAFIDAHNHFFFRAVAELGIDCRTPGLRSVRELLERVARAAARTPAGEWVRGWGYDPLHLEEGRHPSLEELDRAAPRHPVVIQHVTFHQCVANSRALAAVGIRGDSVEPPNGSIGRSLRGRLTGQLYEGASEIVDNHCRGEILARDREACLRALRSTAAQYAAWGITRLCDPGVAPAVATVYRQLLEEPDFPIRIQALGSSRDGLFMPPVDRLAEGADEGGLHVSGIKFFADGGERCAIGMSKRAAIRTAVRVVRNAVRYRSTAGLQLASSSRLRLGRDGRVRSGMLFYHDEELSELVSQTVGLGLTAAIHALGNDGVEQTLRVVAQVRRSCSSDAVFRMEHAMMTSERSLRRMKALGVAAVVQPRFIHDYGFPLLLAGLTREFRVLSFRDLLNEGILVAGSSDAPAASAAVLPAIESAVTRRTRAGELLERDQALTVEEALSLYTTNAARVLGIDDRYGSLSRGKVADFVVLSADPRAVRSDEIRTIAVERTYREGRLVYARGEPGHPRYGQRALTDSRALG